MNNNVRVCKGCKKPLSEYEDNDLCQACRSKRGEKYKGDLKKVAFVAGAGVFIYKTGKVVLKVGKIALDLFKK